MVGGIYILKNIVYIENENMKKHRNTLATETYTRKQTLIERNNTLVILPIHHILIIKNKHS